MSRILVCDFSDEFQKILLRRYFVGISFGDLMGISWGSHGDLLGISFGDLMGISWGSLRDLLGISWGLSWGSLLGISWGSLLRGSLLGIFWGDFCVSKKIDFFFFIIHLGTLSSVYNTTQHKHDFSFQNSIDCLLVHLFITYSKYYFTRYCHSRLRSY